jgi:hypothetical protein
MAPKFIASRLVSGMERPLLKPDLNKAMALREP